MKFAVLVSGGGTNLQALLDADRSGRLAPGSIAVVICNRPGVGAIDRAERAGKPVVVIDHKTYTGREPFEAAIQAVLDAHAVDAVILAGFMRILTPSFVDRWRDRMINIHPSLLPAFPGVDAQRQAFEYGVKVTGCTVHFVDAGTDTGPIIFQVAVPVRDDDDAEKLRLRILEKEHELLPRAAQLLAAGRLVREGRRVRILDA
jgi:phosphoribosylglycinamide formyltransferase-1